MTPKYFRFLFITFCILFAACTTSKSVDIPSRNSGRISGHGLISTHASTTINSVVTKLDGITTSVGYIEYQIKGETTERVRMQLNDLGPIDKSGKHWDAYTEWNFDWSYLPVTEADKCSAESVELSIDIKIITPKWDKPTPVSEELVVKWQTYLLALLKHEEEHKKLILSVGNSLYDSINNLDSYPTCIELKHAINTLGGDSLEQLYQISIEYDNLTEHGKTLGAIFP